MCKCCDAVLYHSILLEKFSFHPSLKAARTALLESCKKVNFSSSAALHAVSVGDTIVDIDNKAASRDLMEYCNTVSLPSSTAHHSKYVGGTSTVNKDVANYDCITVDTGLCVFIACR